jgi:hypothetical protein
MNKEKFLELAGQIYDSTNAQIDKVSASKVILDEIADRISSEINDNSDDIVDDYRFGIQCGNEIIVEDFSIDINKIERIVKQVLNDYFVAI